jgi:hypothetical protein
MGHEEMKDASRPTPIAEKAISHVARRCLKPGARPRTFISQDNLFDARGGKPPADPHSFSRRTRTYAMIDSQRRQTAAPAPHPFGGQHR